MLFGKNKALLYKLFLVSEGMETQINNLQWKLQMSTEKEEKEQFEIGIRILNYWKAEIDAIRDVKHNSK